MITTLTADPGVRSIGWALFEDKALVRCDLIRGKTFDELMFNVDVQRVMFSSPQEIVIEVPQIYTYTRGDNNDLIDVAIVAGAFASRLRFDACEIHFIRPKEWKGQRKKKPDHAHTMKVLTEEETVVFLRADCPASLRHNVLDAIGIGLWRVGR